MLGETGRGTERSHVGPVLYVTVGRYVDEEAQQHQHGVLELAAVHSNASVLVQGATVIFLLLQQLHYHCSGSLPAGASHVVQHPHHC